MAKHPCLLLVPMQYGRSKRLLTAEGMTAILATLNRQFGGCTPIGETRSPPDITPGGQWVDPDTGETVHDVCWLVKVAVDREKLDLFRKVVREIGKELEQKAMYVEIGEPSVEILDVDDDDPPFGSLQSFYDELIRLLEEEDENEGDNPQSATG